MRANKILPELSMKRIMEKLTKHDENLNGFSFHHNPSVVSNIGGGGITLMKMGIIS